MSLPKPTRSSYLVDNHATKVKELQDWIRTAKTAALILLFGVFVNFILMYNLIRYPCSPNPSSCAQFCGAINAPRTLALPTLAEAPMLSPGTSKPVSTEIEITTNPPTKSRDLAVRASGEVGAHLDKRYNWWYLAMGGYWMTAQAIAWWNMVSACKDFSDASNIINCVWGAVSTCITAAGAFYGGYQTYGRVQSWANNNGISFGGFKRDVVDDELIEGLSAILPFPVTYLGSFDYASLGLNGTLSVRESKEPIDVFGFTSPAGLDMHFSFLGRMENLGGSNKKQMAFKFGFGTGVAPGGVKGRALFDQQYFTSGGIDFILDENPSDNGVLSTTWDYGQMDHEVSCYMAGSSDAVGHYFQIYDNNHHDAIAGGAVAPFRGSDHWSAIIQMYNEPFPIALVEQCEVS